LELDPTDREKLLESQAAGSARLPERLQGRGLGHRGAPRERRLQLRQPPSQRQPPPGASSGKAPIGLPLLPLLREDRRQSRISEEEAMALRVRRVVTGHDAAGKAIVQIDEISKNLRSARPGAEACVIWTSEGFPIDNTGSADEGLRETGTTHDNGTVFRILELQPGNTPRIHRTDSLDYAIIMKGEIDMELETGDITHLKAGDVIVQRGTVHNWVNRGPEPCVIAFVLIAAKPVEAGGKVLKAFG
jgi:quercetin dioxygenase-like cupin family protein